MYTKKKQKTKQKTTFLITELRGDYSSETQSGKMQSDAKCKEEARNIHLGTLETAAHACERMNEKHGEKGVFSVFWT